MLFLFAEEEHHENGIHLAGDTNEIIWGSLAFFVLMGLIWWKGGPAIKKMFTGRTERIRSELAAAADERSAAEAALTESSADLPDVSTEESRIRAEAVETAARLKSDMASKAEADAEAIVARAHADAENQKNQGLADLREEVARLTKGAAEAVVGQNLDSASHADLIDNYISQVGQS